MFRHTSLLALVLALALRASAAAQQYPAAGFHRMATAAGDDYFDGADPAFRVRRASGGQENAD